MSLIKGILIKRRVFAILLLLILLVYGCILYLFIRSSYWDEEQSRILEICKNAESEILQCQLNIDELIASGDTLYLNLALSNLNMARQFILSINTENANLGKRFIPEALPQLSGLIQDISKLEPLIRTSVLAKSNSGFADLNHLFSELLMGMIDFNSDLQQGVTQYHIKLKKILFLLFTIGFVVMLYFSYIIFRMIKTVMSTDRYVVDKTIEIEQHERLRIAMDLHDGLGAYLSSIIMYIKLLEKEAAEKNYDKEKLGHINMLANHALRSTKEVINNLNPSALNKYGLIGFLEILCDKINQAGNIQIELETENFQIKLSKSIEVFVYRISNELINNTLKHSGATKAKITIRNLKSTVFIRYIDNGIGFNTSFDYSAGGEKMGLQNLTSRVESIGGKCKIESGANQGVDISIQFSVN